MHRLLRLPDEGHTAQKHAYNLVLRLSVVLTLMRPLLLIPRVHQTFCPGTGAGSAQVAHLVHHAKATDQARLDALLISGGHGCSHSVFPVKPCMKSERLSITIPQSTTTSEFVAQALLTRKTLHEMKRREVRRSKTDGCGAPGRPGEVVGSGGAPRVGVQEEHVQDKV